MPTIVAVDDSATMRKCLEITFKGTEFELITCNDANAALAKVKELSPALAIVDVSLPPKDGYALCGDLKSAAPGVPVLLLSSKQMPFDPAKGSEADGHLDKPFDTQVLQDRARAMLAAAPKVTPQPAAAAPVERAAPKGRIPAPRQRRQEPAVRAKRPAAAARPLDRTMPMGRREQQASAALGRAAVRKAKPAAKPAATKPSAPGLRPSAPGAKPAAGFGNLELDDSTPDSLPQPPKPAAAARAQAKRPAVKLPAAKGSAPAAKAPAAKASSPGKAPAAAQQPTATKPAAPAAAVPEAVAQDLRGKLDALGLDKAQVEGVLALSRDVIEQVVWEVVPVLAETLIKEELKRLTKD